MAIKNRTIKVDELKLVLDAIFTHLKNDLKIDEIELTEDYYREVSGAVLYSIEQPMNDLTVGSLFDDLEFLMPVVSDPNQAASLMLIHVAPLLRYIATKVAQ